MTNQELKKISVGPFDGLQEMQIVWQRFKDLGCHMLREHFDYTDSHNFVIQEMTGMGIGAAYTSPCHAVYTPSKFLSKYPFNACAEVVTPSPSSAPHLCDCDSLLLLQSGCKCGGV